MPQRRAGAPLHARTPSLVNVNNNTSWLSAPGVWTSYLGALLLVWLLLCAVTATPRTAWGILVLAHFGVTFPLFHWVKGSPIAADQGAYDKLTFWEQMDEGIQLTRNKKFFTALPVLLLLPTWQGSDHTSALDLATLAGARRAPARGFLAPTRTLLTSGTRAATLVLLLAKAPFMHRVRLFGVNEE
jgi:hypothetical protein